MDAEAAFRASDYKLFGQLMIGSHTGLRSTDVSWSDKEDFAVLKHSCIAARTMR